MPTDKELVEKLARVERIRREAKSLEELTRPQADIQVRTASSVPSEKLLTAFGGRLIRGAFQLLVGPGEAGKGFASTDIVSRLSTGRAFPGENGNHRQPMAVVVCVTEDSESRFKARLAAADADMDQVLFATGQSVMRGGLIVPAPIAFDDDAGALAKMAKAKGAGALFLETTLEHLGDREGKKQFSTNNEAEVRRCLSPIVAACRDANMIGWGVMHPRKSQGDGGIADSISGSAAFNNVGRSVLHVYKDPKDEESKSPWRLLITSKANYLARRPSTLRFRIEPWAQDPDEGRVVWGIEGRTLVDERDAKAIWDEIREKNRKRTDFTVIAAEKLLNKILANGAVKTLNEVRKAAEDDDLSWRAVERAKENLGVESVKTGFPAKVTGWRLPTQEM